MILSLRKYSIVRYGNIKTINVQDKEYKAQMIQKVISFIEKYNMISEHDLVAVGVSGGADSLCLLFVLLEYRKKIPFELVVVHVNHGIRKEAVLDASFVEEICQREKLPFYLKEADVKKIAKEEHLSEEEAGRVVRYSAFQEALEVYQKKGITGKKIAVAHHQGDSAETMLFHMFRGTGIYGMTGIRPVNGRIFRPLLCVSREEIEEYLKKRGQKWCIDSTNEEDTYTRNKIRHHILGYADKEINEKSTLHVARAALQMMEMTEYLETEVEKMAEKIATFHPRGLKIEILLMKKYPSFLQSQFLLWAVEKVMPGRKDVTFEHIQAILNLTEKQGTKRTHLPGDYEAIKEYDVIWLKKKDIENAGNKESVFLSSEGEYKLENGSILKISFLNAAELQGIGENKYTKYFDYDKINSCLSMRFRQGGDYLVFNDKGQKKSLKEYFIHEKIPSCMRDKVPLIVDGNHVLWIIGYRISAYYKVTKETRKIVQMTIRRDEHVREN